jgi:hypothetical protein
VGRWFESSTGHHKKDVRDADLKSASLRFMV